MNRTDQAHYPTFATSHPGMSGKNNEDRFAVSAFRTDGSQSTPVLLAVLCDGIGGHQAGEVAAEMAVEIISQITAESDGIHPLEILQDAVNQASDQIRFTAETDSNHHGMGATCALVWISGTRLFVGTVGDSRVYLMRAGRIRQLTKDHTWIQEALDAGFIKPDQVKGHPNTHIIRRYLGSPTAPNVDFCLRLTGKENDEQAMANQGMLLTPGDLILICSDGLTDLVTDSELLTTFSEIAPEAAILSLVDLANQRGGHDNITVVAIQVPPKTGKGRLHIPARPQKMPWKWIALGCAWFVLLIALIIGGYFIYLWLVARGWIGALGLLPPFL